MSLLLNLVALLPERIVELVADDPGTPMLNAMSSRTARLVDWEARHG